MGTSLGYQKIDFHLIGVAPLLMHNGRLANPMDPFARAMKAITKKRTKTDDDLIELAHQEFLGGLYTGEDEAPVVPGLNIEGMLLGGAKKSKQGDACKAGVLSDGMWPLIYKGPKTPEELWQDKAFVDVRGCGLRGSTVQRCRPIFMKWELECSVDFLPDVVSEGDVRAWMETAGRLVGLCDYTPRYGRFRVA